MAMVFEPAQENIEIPIIDLVDPNAKHLIVEACKEFGFFKVINHGVPMELIAQLEDEAIKFFNLSRAEKEIFGPPNPFGYGNKRIGPNGDVGSVEYLLFNTVTEEKFVLPKISKSLRCYVNDYVLAMRNMACQVLEMITDKLEIMPRDLLSRLLRDEKSDCLFRLNHYPPCSELEALSGQNVIGFGDHTDPQIISILRSNNIFGLQIALKDGRWVSVPSDHSSFFINVGDLLQVMTNRRFKSVRHRVVIGSLNSRISMIFFGGPPLAQKITPLPSIMEQGEENLYNDFTWQEYKKSIYQTRLSDSKLGLYEKSIRHYH